MQLVILFQKYLDYLEFYLEYLVFKPRATKLAFGFDPLSVYFTEQIQRTEIHF